MLPPLTLLEGLRDDPQSDELQAIYADWLEDQDSPQARLVRLGRELAQLLRTAPPRTAPDHDAYQVRRLALDHQFHEYRLAHQTAWLGPFAALGSDWGYTAGVLTHVAMRIDAFAQCGAELLRQHPIRSLRLVESAGKLDRLHPVEALRLLRRLSLRMQCVGAAGTRELAQCPQFGHLQALDLYLTHIDLPALLHLTGSPNLPHLHELILAHNPLDETAGPALAEALFWPKLTRLNLRGTRIGLRCLLLLARSAHRHALRTLDAHVPGLDRELAEVREVQARFGMDVA